jgi:hypothetical protein
MGDTSVDRGGKEGRKVTGDEFAEALEVVDVER